MKGIFPLDQLSVELEKPNHLCVERASEFLFKVKPEFFGKDHVVGTAKNEKGELVIIRIYNCPWCGAKL